MLTFEGTQIQGADAIVEKLTVFLCLYDGSYKYLSRYLYQSLPIQKVQHKVTTQDAQPSTTTLPSLLVSVTGLLLVSFI